MERPDLCRRCLLVNVLRQATTSEEKLRHIEDHITMECRLRAKRQSAPTRNQIMRQCFPAFLQVKDQLTSPDINLPTAARLLKTPAEANLFEKDSTTKTEGSEKGNTEIVGNLNDSFRADPALRQCRIVERTCTQPSELSEVTTSDNHKTPAKSYSQNDIVRDTLPPPIIATLDCPDTLLTDTNAFSVQATDRQLFNTKRQEPFQQLGMDIDNLLQQNSAEAVALAINDPLGKTPLLSLQKQEHANTLPVNDPNTTPLMSPPTDAYIVDKIPSSILQYPNGQRTCDRVVDLESQVESSTVASPGVTSIILLLQSNGTTTETASFSKEIKDDSRETSQINSIITSVASDDDNLFTCQKCGHMSVDMAAHKSHVSERHNKPWACDDCVKTFRSQFRLYTHIEAAHLKLRPRRQNVIALKWQADNELSITCDECGAQTPHMGCHVMRHLQKDVSCSSDHRAMTDQQFSRHFQSSHSVGRHKCELCSQRFFTPSRLKSHVDSVHLKLPRTEADGGEFVCDQCGRPFVRRSYLAHHLPNHIEEMSYECDVCRRRFRFKSTLMPHMTKHASERHYACDDCDRHFKNRVTLKIHMTIHTGERAFACAVCSVTFRVRVLLRNHRRRYRHFD